MMTPLDVGRLTLPPSRIHSSPFNTTQKNTAVAVIAGSCGVHPHASIRPIQLKASGGRAVPSSRAHPFDPIQLKSSGGWLWPPPARIHSIH